MKTMKKIVLALVLVLALALPALANPFVDVPLNHWAYDAVQSLAAKGIFIGYPDGTFGGNRAMTRYEAAMATARALAYMEQKIDEAGFATQEDIAMLEKLVQEFADELRLLGVTVDDLKRALGEHSEAIAALEARVDVLEKYHEPVLVTGEFNVTYEAFSPTYDAVDDDDDKIFPTFSDETTLHIAADINENTIAGVDLIIKNSLTGAGSEPEVVGDNFYIQYEDEEWFVRVGDIDLDKG
ncbi:MAG TPA: S-layer homology domain-containing protein, partial [Candidatus Atribacteria bacterium]|nr:S-layer homology domain-containing protein [Candidatus Atribacteria bacterium]